MFLNLIIKPKSRKEYLRVKSILLKKGYQLTSSYSSSTFYRKDTKHIQLAKIFIK